MEADSAMVEPVLVREGFDSNRCCKWSIEIVENEFAGYPVQVARLRESYLKRKKNKNVESWVVTTDMSLSPEEMREGAHLRWHIENNVFKRMSHLSGTKTFYRMGILPKYMDVLW
jgi:hypothetical protein